MTRQHEPQPLNPAAEQRNGAIDNDALPVEALIAESGNADLQALLTKHGLSIKKLVKRARYERELVLLQVELVKLQRSIRDQGRRVAIIFEGRDAAGKGGTITRFTEHLNPRFARVVALPKPTEVEQAQWYFQRYTAQLPNAGEITFLDRSWYNRAVVEPVNGFCTEEEYRRFMQQVPEYEHMLHEDGIELVKFWFSISKEEQAERFAERREDPLKQWKISPVDARAQELWDRYTTYKDAMLGKTHTAHGPWVVVRGDDKKAARLESIRYVLATLPYEGKDEVGTRLHPDPDVVGRFSRALKLLD